MKYEAEELQRKLRKETRCLAGSDKRFGRVFVIAPPHCEQTARGRGFIRPFVTSVPENHIVQVSLYFAMNDHKKTHGIWKDTH